MKLCLVIPVYRNEESLPALLRAVSGIAQAVQAPFEAVFVIDGSPDRCYELLREALPQQNFAARLVLLSRNFGAFAAVRAGLQAGDADAYAVMAADLQEPPELVLQMFARLRDEPLDVVVGVRESRGDPLLQRLPAQLFWALYRRWVAPEMPPGGVDIFACNRAFRDTLLQLEERHSSLIAQVFWLGFRRAQVPYQRREREHGQSAWTLRKKMAYLSDSVFAFTDFPIRWLLRLGALGTAGAVAMACVAALGRLSGAIEVPGYAMTIITIVLFGALNLLCLGVVGSYAWRAYENTKARPLAVVLRQESFGETPAAAETSLISKTPHG